MTALLSLQNVSKSYPVGSGTLDVLREVTLNISAGETVALLGRSGSGKTTLLQIAGLLALPSAGTVMLSGQDISRANDAERTQWRHETIGFVYQFHHLLPEFSAAENVAMPLWISGSSKQAALDEAAALLGELGLADRLHHRPAQLSGGEQQRVSIARALANRPALLLADEPTGNLDDNSAGLVFELLMQVVRNRQMAALIATHNLDLAGRIGRSVRLEKGQLV